METNDVSPIPTSHRFPPTPLARVNLPPELTERLAKTSSDSETPHPPASASSSSSTSTSPSPSPDGGFVEEAVLTGTFVPSLLSISGTAIPGYDLFGYGFAVAGDQLFVGAPASQVQKQPFAGATYFFRRDLTAGAGVRWNQSQRPFAPPRSDDQLGFGRPAASKDGWICSQVGSPASRRQRPRHGPHLP